MIRKILSWIGYEYEVFYECEWGVYDSIYSPVDFMCGRPIHPDMSVAPPWATIMSITMKNKSKT